MALVFPLTARLALADLLRDKGSFACQLIALAAVLAPLLLLFGLKNGVVGLMTRQLLGDPEVRQIVIKGGSYPASMLAKLAADPGVGFIGPHPAATNTELPVVEAGRAGAATVYATMLATGRGDPLLAGTVPSKLGETVLSASLARQLGIAAGASVLVLPERTLDGRREVRPLELHATAVLPPTAWQAIGILLAPADLTALHEWGEGFAVPRLGWPGHPPREPVYSTFRLFAADLDSVAPLVARLTELGIPHDARLQRIAALHAFDHTLGLVFLTIAVVAGTGFTVALGASLWGNVVRKRHEVGTLRLLGLTRRQTVLFPLTQGAAVGLGGWLLATLVYAAAAFSLDGGFGAHLAVAGPLGLPAELGQEICRLAPLHHLAALVATLATSLAAAAAAGRRATRIDPAEGMRDAM